MCVWQAEGEKITYSMHGAMLKRKEWSRWSSSGSLKTGSSLKSQGLFLHPRSIPYKQPNVGEIEGMERSCDMRNKHLFITKWESKLENYTDVENRQHFCLGKMKIWACHHLTAQFIPFCIRGRCIFERCVIQPSFPFLKWTLHWSLVSYTGLYQLRMWLHRLCPLTPIPNPAAPQSSTPLYLIKFSLWVPQVTVPSSGS